VDGPTRATSFAFALMALLTALTRPDGLVLAVLMGAAILYALRERSAWMLTIALVVFLVLGGAYFLWRYHYFGYLLPNPFYKKGGGHLYPESMKFSITNVLKMILPVTPVIWFALASKSVRKRAVFLLIPLVGFACVWILLTVENNWNMRFQFVLLPITLMTIPYLMNGLREPVSVGRPARPWSRAMSVATVAAALMGSLLYWRVTFPPGVPDGSSMHDIAVSLAQFKDKGYTMAITEAGTLPYFSGWRAIDTWGLNDSHIMHDPLGLSDAYLDESRPAILMYHAGMETRAEFRDVWLGDGQPVAGPPKFNGPLSHYAVTHNYELIARWGATPCNVHIWYVRRDIPDFEAIKKIILRQPHFFLDGGLMATNYMQPDPPRVCGDPGEHLGWRD
jgi:arabinofuranosyltransferase